MKLNLTVEEAIYILNRLKGREIDDMAELMFKMNNSKKLVSKINKFLKLTVLAVFLGAQAFRVRIKKIMEK